MRKHGKWILAIMGVVLMVVWVLPDKSSMTGRSAQEIGRLGGKKVTDAQVIDAANDAETLRALISPQFLPPFSRDNIGLHYLLLLEEARRLGVAVTQGEAENLAEELREPLRRARISEKRGVYLMRQFLMLRKAQALSSHLVQMSLPELEHMAADTQSRVSLAYVALLADRVDMGPPLPNSVEVQEHFNTYKDVLPETAAANPPERNGHRYPFAYKFPDRVKIEFIKIPYESVRDKAKPQNPTQAAEDEEKAFQYYQENLDKFRPNPEEPPASATSQGATQKNEPTKFEAVRERLLNEQIDARAHAMIKTLGDRLHSRLLAPWNARGKDEKGYFKELPRENWESYEKIAAEVGSAEKVKLQPSSETAWLGFTDVQKLPGIGKAALVKQNRAPVPLPRLALNVRELVPNQTGGTYLQVGAEGPVLTDEAGSLYIYRVTAAEAAHEPKDVEEVREQVILDIKRLGLYKQRVAEGEALATEASKVGIKAAAAKAGHTLQISEPFPRREIKPRIEKDQVIGTLYENAPIPGIGNAPTIVERAFELAAKTGPVSHAASQPAPEPGTTRPAATQSGDLEKAKAAVAVPVESQLAVYVFSIDTYAPLSEDMFSMLRQYYVQQSRQIHTAVFQNQWSSLKTLAERLNYVPKGGGPLERE